MRAGELNRSIVVQENAGTGTDSFGAPVETWQKIHSDDTLPARVDYAGGSERFVAQQIVGKQTAVFKIRWRTDITVLNRIVYDGRNWDIAYVDIVGNRDALQIGAIARSE